MRVTVNAPAKLNLSLDITGLRSDGYHLLEMVMQSVDLCDTVTVGNSDNGNITIMCNDDTVPSGEDNIAYRAAEAFFKETELENTGVTIKIKKRIPLSAGLAGGSTDAAATLVGLNELFQTNLAKDELCGLGLMIGADVPFCIMGGTVFAEGIGGILNPLPDLRPCYFVIAKKGIKSSTKEMYEKFDLLTHVTHPHTQHIVDAICSGDLTGTAKNLANVFEFVLGDEIEELKQIMYAYDAIGASLSGSGPAVFGVFESYSDASHCANELKKICEDVFICEPLKTGCEIID